MSSRKQLCDAFVEALKDEGVASIDYGKLADRLRESDIPEIKNLSILLEKISQDEQSHKIALGKVAKIVCPIK